MSAESFSRLTAAERAAALVDAGSLELLPAESGERLAVLAARGRIAGRRVLLALTDGHTRGGTIGLAEARHLSRALAGVERAAVVVGWDTGGVRVHEGPAALAAASGVGIALTRLSLCGSPIVHLVSGPRGCFGAPAVIAAAGRRTLLVEGAFWGLTGPQLVEGARSEREARAAMAAAFRVRAAHAGDLVDDRPAAVRARVAALLGARRRRVGAARLLADGVVTTERLLAQWSRPSLAAASAPEVRTTGRQRDFFAYSFRRQWQPLGPTIRRGHVHAARGALAGRPAMAIIVGPDPSPRGIGIEDADAVLRAVGYTVRTAPGAPIVTFVFCRGHASDLHEERAGLPRALGECLRGMVAARLAGHPLLCVLGGGAYGAAYLTLAAPSHRVLAIRGTAVAPMAPRVLAAFQRLRGVRQAPDTPPDLAELLPEIRIVDNVVRLPRALGEEIEAARRATDTPPRTRFSLG